MVSGDVALGNKSECPTGMSCDTRSGSSPNGFRWRDLLVCISLANCWYFRVWSELLTYTRSDMFYMRTLPPRSQYLATSLDVVLLGFLFAGGTWLFRRHANGRAMRIGAWVFLAGLAVPLNAIRAVLANAYFPILKGKLLRFVSTDLVFAGLICGAAICVYLIIRHHNHLTPLASAVLVALFPAFPLFAIESAWVLHSANSSILADPSPARLLVSAAPQRRVIWALFDELDYRLAFVDRHTAQKFPALDRLRREAIFATDARSPSTDTIPSVPSLLTGEPFSLPAITPNPNRLVLRADDGSSVPLAARRNVFCDLRQLGYSSAILGWYLPYARLMNACASQIEWWPMARQITAVGDTVPEMMWNETRGLFETSIFSPFGQSLVARAHAEIYRKMLARAKSLVTDQRFSFIYVHFPIPHSPNIYDRRTETLTLANSPVDGYLGNLLLVDRTVAELRTALENAGQWDDTTILITSDHPYRTSMELDGKKDRRIPFILKFRRQSRGSEFKEQFNTLLTRKLMRAIFDGSVTSAPGAESWITAESTGHAVAGVAK